MIKRLVRHMVLYSTEFAQYFVPSMFLKGLDYILIKGKK